MLKRAVAVSRGRKSGSVSEGRPIFQQPFSLPESAQTFALIEFRAARKSSNTFPAASKFAAETLGKSQRVKRKGQKLLKTSRKKKKSSQKIFQKISQKIEDITFTGF